MNEIRRPNKPRNDLDRGIADLEPEIPFDLDTNNLQHNSRTARIGLESSVICALIGDAANQIARAQMPAELVQTIRLGKMTTLQKPDGGVRGIVVGDVFCRLTARTMAQQISNENPETTISSIDGVGAFDLISRNAMFQSVREKVDGDNNPVHPPILRFAVDVLVGTRFRPKEKAVNKEIP